MAGFDLNSLDVEPGTASLGGGTASPAQAGTSGSNSGFDLRSLDVEPPSAESRAADIRARTGLPVRPPAEPDTPVDIRRVGAQLGSSILPSIVGVVPDTLAYIANRAPFLGAKALGPGGVEGKGSLGLINLPEGAVTHGVTQMMQNAGVGPGEPRNWAERIASAGGSGAGLGASEGPAGAAAGLVSGLVGQTAAELAPEKWKEAAGFFGSLLGGGVGAAGTHAAAEHLVTPRVAAGKAATAFKGVLSDPEGAQVSLALQPTESESAVQHALDPSAPPELTTAQATFDPKMAAATNALQGEAANALAAKRFAQADLRTNALEAMTPQGNPGDLVPGLSAARAATDARFGAVADQARTEAQRSAAGVPPAQTPEALGTTQAKAVADRQAELKTANDANWDAVRDLPLQVEGPAVRNVVSNPYVNLSSAVKLAPEETAIRSLMTAPVAKGGFGDSTAIPLRDMTALKTRVGEAISAARRNGDNDAAGRLSQVYEGLINTVNNAAENPAAGLRGFVDTRGGGQEFHGSKNPNPLVLDSDHSAATNYYGPRFYTTDAFDISHGYTKGRGAVSAVTPRPGLRLLDMEHPVPAWLSDHIEKLPGGGSDSLAQEALEEKPANVRELYDNIRDLSKGEGVSMGEVQEFFEELANVIQTKGFDGLQHTGGLRTNHPAHQVRIYFDPAKDIAGSSPVDPEAFRAPGPPVSAKTVIQRATASHRALKAFEAEPQNAAALESKPGEGQAALPKTVFQPGPTGAESAQRFRDSLGDSVALPILRDNAASALRGMKGAVADDGTISPEALADFQHRYGEALRAIPDAPELYRDVESAQRALEDAEAVRQDAMKAYDLDAAAGFLGLTNAGSVVARVGDILGGKQAAEQMGQLAASARNAGSAAFDGLRRAAVDALTTKFLNPATGSLDGAKLLKFLAQPQTEGGLRAVLTDDERTVLRGIAAELESENALKTAASKARVSASDTRIAPAEESSPIRAAAKIVLKDGIPATIGGVLGSLAGPGGVAAGIIGAGAAAHIIGGIRARGLRSAQAMLDNAILNAPAGRALLEAARSPTASSWGRFVRLLGQPTLGTALVLGTRRVPPSQSQPASP